MIKHIVMWNVRGDDAVTHARNLALLKAEFESLRGRIPGLLHLEVGIDESRVDYACDVVLYTEFAIAPGTGATMPSIPSTCACAAASATCAPRGTRSTTRSATMSWATHEQARPTLCQRGVATPRRSLRRGVATLRPKGAIIPGHPDPH